MSTTVVSTSVAAVMVSVVAGVSAMVVASDAQMIVIIGAMSCGTPRDQSFVQAAVRVLSPAAWGDTYVALVGGNLAMLGAALLLHLLVTMGLMKKRSVPFSEACATTRFPSLLFLVAIFVHQGIVFGGVKLLLTTASTDRPSSSHVFNSHHTQGVELGMVLGVACCLYAVVLPFASTRFVVQSQEAHFNKYDMFDTRSWVVRFLVPQGFWGPKILTRSHGGMFGGVVEGRRLFSSFNFILINVTGCIAALEPSTPSGCNAQYMALGVVCTAAALLFLAVQAHRVPAFNALQGLSLVLLAVMSWGSNAQGATGRSVFRNASVAQSSLCAIRALYALGVMIVERKVWKKQAAAFALNAKQADGQVPLLTLSPRRDLY